MTINWQEYSKVVEKYSSITRRIPSVYEYMILNIIENGLIVILVILIIGFVVIGCFIKGEIGSYILHMATLCLGVFLGLFIGNNGKKK